MTREEAIAEIERLLDWAKKLEGPQTFVEFRPAPALEMALAALRPVSREQVEKMWRGCNECTSCKLCIWNETKKCNGCKNMYSFKPLSNFCPRCGKPLTDKAVQMVMERLEEMRNG